MNNPVGVSETLGLLGQLRQAIGTTLAKGKELDRVLRASQYEARGGSEAEAGKLDEENAQATGEIEAAAVTEKAGSELRESRRRERINAASQRVLLKLCQPIDEAEGRQKYAVQSGLLQAGRTRDTELANAKQAIDEFHAVLALEHERLLALTQTTQATLGSFRGLVPAEAPGPAVAGANLPADEHELLESFRRELAQLELELERFRRLPGPLIFRFVSLTMALSLAVIGHVAGGALMYLWRSDGFSYGGPGISLGVSLVVLVLLWLIGRQQARPAAVGFGGALARARQLHDAAAEAATRHNQQKVEAIELACASQTLELNEAWSQVLVEPDEQRAAVRRQSHQRTVRILETHDRLQQARRARFEAQTEASMVRLQAEAARRRQELADRLAAKMAEFTRENDGRWRAVDAELKAQTGPIFEVFMNANAADGKLHPASPARFHEEWRVPTEFPPGVRFGRLEVDVGKLAGLDSAARRWALPGPAQLSIPVQLTFPRHGSVLFETTKTGHDEAVGTLNQIILGLLATAPTARLNFSIIDPVGLGQNFAAITHLADYGDNLISGRIWTQSAQIEKRLGELNEHMEKVIQMYLRNEYETIADYNEKAGNIAEKYHFLVIADFPVNFSETAIRRLLSIATSGARCGVFTLIHWDRRQPQPEVSLDDLRKSSVCLTCKGSGFVVPASFPDGTKLVLDAPPEAAAVTGFIQKVGAASINANRVEVPFADIAPKAEEVWSLDTTTELRVPIGRIGATKFQYLAIGRGTRQHALIAGKTGSGKSTLFHVIITNLAMWCSPEQVEFYLVDFKKGVEFQCYAASQLPHARVIAIESDREFGLSVLQRLDEELRRRGELFRRLGAQDLAGYKRAGGTEAVPRALLLIDEFQEFFVEDDRISQNAALLLDRIVRQGRAFGIHALLGSQTLGGAYTLARTTLGQMVIRIALQCNEADAYLIMDDNNPAPRLLSRPGEGIYNDTAGTIEGNSPFQTVWLPDEVREGFLEQARARALRQLPARPAPIIFEGNVPANVRDNSVLRAALETRPEKAPAPPRLWLGAPNSIKGPTEATFQRRSGSNLLVVGQREEAALAILSVGLISLATQYPAGAARFIVFDLNPAGSAERGLLEQLARMGPHELVLTKAEEIGSTLDRLADELKTRSERTDAGGQPEIFLFINGLQKLKKLRHEEDFGFGSGEGEVVVPPGRQLNDLICEGPAHGIHVIVVLDTYNNVNRCLSRKALGEFEMRVLFQMGANDSASLIDSPRASNLGLHRAVYYNEPEGHLEVFRPYALPDEGWLEEVGRWLAAR